MIYVRKLPRLLLLVGLVAILCLTAACRRPAATWTPGQGTVEGATAIPAATAASPASDDEAPATLAPAVTPSPAYSGHYDGMPTPNPTPSGFVTRTGVESYVIQSGQTLSWIAGIYGCTVDEIVAANGLPNADSVSEGQTILIPVSTALVGPETKLVPDSEVVYSPAYIHFDTVAFSASQGGYLADYAEDVEGRTLSGAEIVRLVAERFSVGPRVLLALLELHSGWVTQAEPSADTLAYPLGYIQGYDGLFEQLNWVAGRLNEGYYGWKTGRRTTIHLADGTRVSIAPGLNPGTVAVQNCLAEHTSGWDEWSVLVGPSGFSAVYERLFGNPFAYSVDPLVPPDLVQPELRLPWEAGTTWYLTSGPHGGWSNDGSVAALDFAPSERHLGCAMTADWATAAGAGLVVRSEDGQVILDLDGDGYEQSGWVLVYLHVDADGRVPAGTYVGRGDPLGHPSCEGGFSEATHLHFARRYNGEWIAAGRAPAPMVLSGWLAQEGDADYEGTLVKGGQVRTAAETWNDRVNGLVSDNVP